MNIFFGKISQKIDVKQISDGFYKADPSSKWFNGIDINDYAFVIGGGKIQLWKAKEWKTDRLEFDIIFDKVDMNVNKLIAFKYFKIDSVLAVLTVRQVSKAFFPIQIVGSFSEEDLLKKETYSDLNNFRKIALLEKSDDIDSSSINIQLYYDNNNLKLFASSFLDNDLINNFRDNLNHFGGGRKNKDKVLNKIKSIQSFPKTFEFNKLSIRDFYDSFCVDYGAKDPDIKSPGSEITTLDVEEESSNDTNKSLNQILYGPPGTGKTFHTVKKAAEIIENRIIHNYQEAQKIFNDNLGDRIEFITFHQNYSYEDFIQGLKPDVNNTDGLFFERKDGIFKLISDRALQNYKLATKKPEEISEQLRFENALEKLIDKIEDSEDNFKITESAYIFGVEDDAFRYTGENWTKHANGLRMKFSDLREFFNHKVSSRKDVKKIKSISDLANQHATYYIKVYQEILKHISKNETKGKEVKLQNYVLIIDEINRANISRVFGELITLIEPDKRSNGSIPLKATLPSGEEFVVPSNLYIIGTMNTADKSIALLDIALRRRFDFEPMYPLYKIDGYDIFDIEILKKINEKIIDLKGYDFQIGHSYFMDNGDDTYNYVNRMNKKVIPLLLEYFMNDKDEVINLLNKAGVVVDEKSWPLKIQES